MLEKQRRSRQSHLLIPVRDSTHCSIGKLCWLRVQRACLLSIWLSDLLTSRSWCPPLPMQPIVAFTLYAHQFPPAYRAECDTKLQFPGHLSEAQASRERPAAVMCIRAPLQAKADCANCGEANTATRTTPGQWTNARAKCRENAHLALEKAAN